MCKSRYTFTILYTSISHVTTVWFWGLTSADEKVLLLLIESLFPCYSNGTKLSGRSHKTKSIALWSSLNRFRPLNFVLPSPVVVSGNDWFPKLLLASQKLKLELGWCHACLSALSFPLSSSLVPLETWQALIFFLVRNDWWPLSLKVSRTGSLPKENCCLFLREYPTLPSKFHNLRYPVWKR